MAPAYPTFSAGPKPMHFRQLTLDRLDRFDSDQDYASLTSVLDEARTDSSEFIQLERWSSPGRSKTPFNEAVKQKFSPVKKGESIGPSWTNHWYKVSISLPKEWVARKPERITFEWDPSCEAMIFDTEGLSLHAITGGHGIDRRVEYILPPSGRKGIYRLWIEVSCNGMFGVGEPETNDPPNNNRFFKLESADLVLPNMTAWRLMWDFRVLKDLAKQLDEHSQLGNRCMEVANAIVNMFDPTNQESLVRARKLAADKVFGAGWEELGADIYKGDPSAADVFTIGNCHIDTAWLWTYSQTRQKTARSWSTQLDLMDRYPEHTFVASQAQQFAWLEKDYPLLFNKLKARVAEGRFQPIGGCWVEADVQMSSGEAIARQFLYGQRFFKSRFGSYCRTFWLPDSFGYSSQLPQLCRLAGLDSFFTQKLSWSQFNQPVHSTFMWVGQDGTQILTHFPPVNTYTAQASVADVRASINNHKSLQASSTALLAYGNGDGGGGPLPAMLENLRRCRAVSDKNGELPKVTLGGSVQDFYDDVLNKTDDGKSLPTWNGELYLELHRGTATSHGIIKKGNRKSEILLREVEYAATLASTAGVGYAYPKDAIDPLWENTLLNQFHDVLPGSGIGLIYEDAERIYREVAEKGGALLEKALQVLVPGSVDAFDANAEGDELIAVNTTPFARREIVKIPLSSARSLGEAELQFSHDGGAYALVDNLAGHAVTTATSMSSFASSKMIPSRAKANGDEFVLSNETLAVTISAEGRITSMVDLGLNRQLIAEGESGGFVIFRDEPLNWDAWDVDLFHLETKSEVNATKIKILEDGPLRSSIQLTLDIGEKTTAKVIVSLDAVPPLAKEGSLSQLRFECTVDWHEKHRFLKFELPTRIRSEFATFENQFGAVQRPTTRNTSWERAKFETCGHKFMDLSEWGYGVSILNDCKYGMVVEGTTMRLSLLRAPTVPDADSDQYEHTFSFAVLPHRGSFGESDTPAAGWIFNSPPHLRRIPRARLAAATAFVKPVWLTGTRNVLMETIKRGEDDHFGEAPGENERATVIVRIYEAFGGHGKVELNTNWDIECAHVCDLLERDTTKLVLKPGKAGASSVALELRGYEVKSIKLTLKPSQLGARRA